MTFNLLHRDWIVVRYNDGIVREVSLLQAFADAAKIDRICGELPTQDIAILRLMLAVLYRALPAQEPVEIARQVLTNRTFGDAVATYLAPFEDRFDLLDPVQPFMQVPGDTGWHDKEPPNDDLRNLVLDVLKKDFTIGLRPTPESIGLAEAARWIVNAHQTDTGGKKNKLVGVRGHGKSDGSVSTAGITLTGCYVAEGATLLDTLVLNMVGTIDSRGLPYWEHPQPDGGPQHRPITGAADVYTWQARRILLKFNDNGRVNGAVVGAGDPINSDQDSKITYPKIVLPRNADPMVGWKTDKGVAKSAQPSPLGGWITLFDASRDVEMSPELLNWLADLADEGVLSSTTVPIRAVTVTLVSGGRITGIHSSVSSVPVALTHNETALLAARQAASVAFECTKLLTKLNYELQVAAGRTGKGAGVTRDSDFAATGALVTAWLPSLLDSPQNALNAFPAILRTHLNRRADELVRQAGAAAAVGSMGVNSKKEPKYFCATSALADFRRNLSKNLKEIHVNT